MNANNHSLTRQVPGNYGLRVILHSPGRTGIIKTNDKMTYYLSPCESQIGQKDISLVQNFEDRERDADIINGFFDGEQIVSEQNVLEEAAGYDKQMRQIRRRHRIKRDLRGDEFLSGFFPAR